jgi:hypothetical protein
MKMENEPKLAGVTYVEIILGTMVRRLQRFHRVFFSFERSQSPINSTLMSAHIPLGLKLMTTLPRPQMPTYEFIRRNADTQRGKHIEGNAGMRNYLNVSGISDSSYIHQRLSRDAVSLAANTRQAHGAFSVLIMVLCATIARCGYIRQLLPSYIWRESSFK